jgi:hypothetical protein
MEVSGQLHAPAALPQGKQLPLAIVYEAAWAQEQVWMLWRREKSLSHTENRTPIPRSCSPLLSRYID